MIKPNDSLSNQIHGQIREYIFSGQVKPGEKLGQRALAKRFGVATTPIREALIKLESESIVEFIPGLGTRVRPIDESTVNGITIIRKAIECECIREFVENANNEELGNLMSMAKKCDGFLDAPAGTYDLKSLSHHDYLYHFSIAQGSHCRELVNEFKRVNLMNIFIHVDMMKTDSNDLPKGAHVKITQAITDKDILSATDIMREHINSSALAIINYYKTLEMQ